jgi:hypothetical protein
MVKQLATWFLWFWDFFLGYPKTMKFRDFQRSLTWKKVFMTVFESIGQFFFQNNVFKLQEVISEHGIRVFFEGTKMKVSRHFLFYRFQTNQRC